MKTLVPLLIAILLVSCTGARSPIIVSPLPTIPTATNTSLPPTETPDIPTSTPVPQQVIPTTTRISLDPGTTPTSPLGPTFTPAPPTTTFTPAPTELGIEIEYFITNAEIIAPGDNVTLFWQVRGANQITIYQLDDEGGRLEPRPVREEGQITLSTSTEATELAVFALVAEINGFEVEELLEIEVNCDGQWFFTPAAGGCPSVEPVVATFAEQQFERGLMIWSSTTNEIFIFYEDNNVPQWQRIADNFRDGDPERDESLIPPADLLQPIRGFGLAWRNTPDVRQRLGWATESESGFGGTIQSGVDGNGGEVIYLQRRNGNILQLLPEGSEWQLIIPDINLPEAESE